MTVPGDATTGSTLLNDLAAAGDWILAILIVGTYAAALIIPVAYAIRAAFNDLTKR